MINANNKVSYMENTYDVVMNLSDVVRPFPRPSRISLNIQREQEKTADDVIQICESRVIFNKITRHDIGSYSLSVTNYHLDDVSSEVGTSSSSFFTDVTCKI